jgi:hypothetical protein
MAISIARWLFNEASSGQIPTTVADDTGNGNNLTINYNTADANWTSNAAGNGLDFVAVPSTAQTARIELSDIDVNGTIYSSLNNATTFSIFINVENLVGNAVQGHLMSFGRGVDSWESTFLLNAIGTTALKVEFSEDVDGLSFVEYNSLTLATINTIRFDIDTTQAAEDDRCKLYVDNVLIPPSGAARLPLNAALYFNPALSHDFNIGNTSDRTRNIQGQIYYAELFTGTSTTQERLDSHTNVLANNDVNWWGAPPSITDIDTDEIVTQGQTGVTVTGLDFGASQGIGLVKISQTNDVNDAGAITQTITSWSDTSLQLTANLPVPEGYVCFVFVKNNSGAFSAGFQITREIVSILPVITDVDTDEIVLQGQANIIITGTSFKTNGVLNRLIISPTDDVFDSAAITQLLNAWSDTSLDFTADLPVAEGQTAFVFVIDNAGNNNLTGFQITRQVPSAGATITTDTIKNYSGAVQASQSGWVANIYNKTTGVLVARLTNLSTDVNGILVITDNNIVASVTYRVDIDNGAGLFGNKEYVAA